MKINSIEHAEKELGQLYDLVKKRGPDGLALDRMWPLLEAAGNPHEQLRVIHVAGTSGKTSTCYYISALLSSSGQKVGLTVSPHVDSITERIQVNGEPISETEFCRELGEFLDLVHAMEETPSYFEVMISFAFWYFAKHRVDYVVAETGLGGLLDGTNTVTRADKVCVITDIGMDHMHILGSNIREIAAQKAGIIQRENVAFMIDQSEDVMEVVRRRIAEKHASLNVIGDQVKKDFATEHTTLPLFQKRNWYLSQKVCAYIAQRDQFDLDHNFNPAMTVVPGRMELQQLSNGSLLILDSAHNGQKIEAFVSSFTDMFINEKATVLLALKTGKEHVEVLENIKEIVHDLIITSFESEQDFPIRSQSPESIAINARDIGMNVEVIDNYEKAYRKLMQSPQKIKLVIGSIYLLSLIRKIQHDS